MRRLEHPFGQELPALQLKAASFQIQILPATIDENKECCTETGVNQTSKPSHKMANNHILTNARSALGSSFSAVVNTLKARHLL